MEDLVAIASLHPAPANFFAEDSGFNDRKWRHRRVADERESWLAGVHRCADSVFVSHERMPQTIACLQS